MFLFLATAWAQDGAAPQPEGFMQMVHAFAPFLLILVIFYMLIFRPQQKQVKERKKMLAALGRGDEVITNGGIYGKITDLTENFVMLQIANSVTIKLDRSQVNIVRSDLDKKK